MFKVLVQSEMEDLQVVEPMNLSFRVHTTGITG